MKLLLAEDQLDLARPVCVILEKSGFSVDVAADGIEALGMLRSNEYDAVLLDVMMPGMSGWEVLAQIRADGNQVPVMMLTAMDSLDDKVRGLEGGADDYMTKPIEMREMVARVRAMTRTRPQPTRRAARPGSVPTTAEPTVRHGGDARPRERPGNHGRQVRGEDVAA